MEFYSSGNPVTQQRQTSNKLKPVLVTLYDTMRACQKVLILTTLCLKKNVLTLKRYSSKLQRVILMKFGRNIQNTLE